MRLTELEPSFLVLDGNGFKLVDEINGADGIMFLCPLCFLRNKGSIGTHSFICWRHHVPQTINPKPGRWQFFGTGYNDLSLDNSPLKMASSVKIEGACGAHFHIHNGNVDLCNDVKV